MNENKIFVGGLSWETTKEKLSEYFSKYGEVTDCIIMTNLETGKSRGFGFVTFKNEASVQEVLLKYPHELDGQNIDPKKCNTKNGFSKFKKDTGYNKIFVGGLPHDIKENTLRQFFNKFGNVTDIVIMYDQEKKKTRGFGFITFENEEMVNKLVNERFLNINGKKVEIKRAEPQRPILRSNSSSMTNISMQSSQNEFLHLNPYGAPVQVNQMLTNNGQTARIPATIPPSLPASNPQLDHSFQIPYNRFGTISLHHPHRDSAHQGHLISHDYPPIHFSAHELPQPSSFLTQPWISTHQMPHPQMQSHMPTSPGSSETNNIPPHSLTPNQIQAISTVPTNIQPNSSPATTSSTGQQQNANNQQQNSSIAAVSQVQTAHQQQQPLTPIYSIQNWYNGNQNTHGTQMHPTLASPISPIQSNASHLASNTFGASLPYCYGGFAHGAIIPTTNLSVAQNWQAQNPFIYGAYPFTYPTAAAAAAAAIAVTSPSTATPPANQKDLNSGLE